MTSLQLSDYIDILSQECTKLESNTSVSGIHATLKNLYKVIKKYAFKDENFSSLANEDSKRIYSLIKSLVLILIDDAIPAEVMLLCGTCLSLLVTSVFCPKYASSFLLHTYCLFHEKYSGKQAISDESKVILKDEVLNRMESFVLKDELSIQIACQMYCEHIKLNNSASLKTASFQQIAILNGIVSCQIAKLYCYQLSFFQDKSFLVVVFTGVYQCCLSPSVHQYHAFSVLLNWMKMCEIFVCNFYNKNYILFAENGDIVLKILNLLESNWQSPIKGLTRFIKEIYKSLIKLNEKECKVLGLDYMQFIEHLLEKTMKLSWQAKGKYFLLSVILQNMDYSKFLEENTSAPTNIIFNLKANYISSSAAEVYKIIVSNMKKSGSKEEFCSNWCNWWRQPILKFLCSDDRLLIQNVTNNILPWTMKNFPETYKLMIEVENQDDSVKLLLLRVAKENFPCLLDEKALNLINKNLHHADTQVRTEILSILCSSSKKSEPVKSNELDFIKVFVIENLNVDSAPFHQYLLSQLHALLIRIRDSLAQQYRSEIQNKDGILDSSQLKFVDWLTHIALVNTFPGACFQRRRLSLQLLNVIYDVFIESPLGFKRKEKPSKSVDQLIKWAQENNLWLFFNNDMLTYILPCITDFADEIRSVSADLLCKYSSWPSLNDYEDVSKAAITEFALALCNHPDYRNNDGGAQVCCIIFNRLCHQTQEKCNQALEFFKYLILVTKLQLESAKEDFLYAAVSKPIHGMLLALQYCLADSKSFFIKSFFCGTKEALDFIKDVMSLCFSIVNFMLKVMKGENENYFCPSFSDIGKAMEKLASSQKKSVSNSVDDSTLVKDVFDSNESSESANLSDLLLSCCWHSIKNSCFLLCEVSELILVLDIDCNEKKKISKEIAEQFSSILIACRHRGVVEACCGALNKFCINLLNEKSIYEDVTMGLLKLVFECLNDSTNVSVTRRSAGLPLLFQAVVSSEENNINRQLLSYTTRSLLKIINKPLPFPDSICEKNDLPQAQAYHILKALVLEARLSQSILPYFDSIIPACIAAFSSTVWAIRNGALQLFGVILPRVCGQKKVRDDDSEHNMVSAFELFARCPSLKSYLLQELTKCVKFHHERKLSSELVPILCLLVKLMPEQNDQRTFMMDFIPLLLELLNIPVWKVRDLASSALALLLPNYKIVDLLDDIILKIENENFNPNEIHSLLLIVQKFLKRKRENILSNLSWIEVNLVYIFTIVHKEMKCPLLLGITVDMMMLVADAKNDLTILQYIETYEMARDISKTQQVGFIFSESKIILATLKTCSDQFLPQYVKKVLPKNKDIQRVCLQFLSDKLNSEKTSKCIYFEDRLKLWKEIFVSVLDYTSFEKHPSVKTVALNFMIDLCSDSTLGKMVLDLVVDVVFESLKCHLNLESGLSVSASAFTMWSICIRNVLENSDKCFREKLEKWSLLFSSYCHPRSTDVLRFEAAKSLAILGPSLAKYLDRGIKRGSDDFVPIFIDLCEGSLLLLQDEDENIRHEACKFSSQLPHNYFANILQYNISRHVIFQYMVQVLHGEAFYLLYLWNRLQNYPPTSKILISYSTSKKTNLFEQEYVNVYAEPHQILIQHLQNFKIVLTELSEKNHELYQENINMFLCDLQTDLQDVHAILSSLTITSSNQSFTYHHQVYLALKKLRCQVEVLMSQKNLILSNEPLYCKLTGLNKQWTNIEKLLPSVTCWFLNIF